MARKGEVNSEMFCMVLVLGAFGGICYTLAHWDEMFGHTMLENL